jgi:predicted MFS family arabinose efflux permease
MSVLSGFRNIWHALQNRNYGIYAAGNIVYLTGSWMQRVAVGWLTWELTQSGAWLGAIAFADLFPGVVIAPIAGVIADRYDGLKLIKITQLLMCGQSLALLGLTATGLITPELLVLLTTILGLIGGFSQTTRLMLITSLVPKEDLPAAVATNSITFNTARFTGAAAGGAMIVAAGPAGAFAATSLCFLVMLFALSQIRLIQPEQKPGGQHRSILADASEGIRYLVRHGGIGPLMALLFVSSICVRPTVELLPGFAADVFHRGADGLAILMSALGGGAVVGGLYLAQRPNSPEGLAFSALGYTMLLGILLLAFVVTDIFAVAVPSLALAGFAMIGSAVGIQTILQLSVDPVMRGRVLSLYTLIMRGGPALGALIMGVLSEWIGLRWPVAGGVAILFLFWLWAWRRRRRIADAFGPRPAAPAD